MKDITHYFMDIVKCETPPTESKEVTKQSPYTIEENRTEGNTVKRRSRVKIKISRKDSIDTRCQIIESTHDQIDKTPSPFTKTHSEEHVQECETPKSILSLNTSVQSIKNLQTREKMQILKEINVNNSLQITDDGPVITELNTDKLHNVKSNSTQDIISAEQCISVIDSDSQIEEDTKGSRESNAFQVLMTRSKPIQYIPQSQISDEDIDINAKKSEERQKLSSYKEKLVALANKKGYAKRKLIEMEEAEQIEDNIQNRIKLFKSTSKTNNHQETTVTNCKNSPSSLLNYFSKTSADQSTKNMLAVSTIIVKADVHISETSESISPLNSTKKKLPSKKSVNHKSNSHLQYADDIQLLASEQLTPALADNEHEADCQTKRVKPRWSLRIKLQSEDDASSGDDRRDKIASLRDTEITSKRKTSGKTPSYTVDDNEQCKQFNNSSMNKNERSQKTKNAERKQQTTNKPNLTNDNRRSSANSDDKNTMTTDKNHKVITTDKSKQFPPSVHSQIDNKVEDVVIIDHVSTSNMTSDTVNVKRKPNEKLAPLFTKKYKTDPAVLAARRSFLKSDVIYEGRSENSNSSKSTDKKMPASGTPSLPFPLISHITQLESDKNFTDMCKIDNMKLKKVSKYEHRINLKNYKLINNSNSMPTDSLKNTVKKTVKENIDAVLAEMEMQCPDAGQIWQSICCITKDVSTTSLKNKSRKTKRNDKKVLSEPQDEKYLIPVSAWTSKYKPTSTVQVIGNEEAALKLREWLSRWSSTATKEDQSSGDEFYYSDCSISSIKTESNQVAVLLGPHGSGKTASVYAVAEELGYSILEVNASSKRHGKKILKEFEEATKSHRVKKHHGGLLFASAIKEKSTKNISQNSLILFEDIDLIFEEDDGFISAVYQLASNTKRPIVMTCRDVCPHLNKMAPEQNRIYFHAVTGNRVIALLELISLVETGCRIPRVYLTDLLRSGDLRRALLQLQYVLLSGIPVKLCKTVIGGESVWRDMRHYLYKPAIKKKKEQKKAKKKNVSVQVEKDQDHLSSLVEDIDSLSLISSLVEVEDTALNLTYSKPQPSLSLTEDATPYHNIFEVTTEIAEWLGHSAMYKKQVPSSADSSTHDPTLVKKQLNTGVDLALSQVTPTSLDRRALSVDYLPYVRTICRIEECRSTLNVKRGNRFFHYLHGLKLPASSTKPNILAAACKMMQEKQENVQKHSNGPT